MTSTLQDVAAVAAAGPDDKTQDIVFHVTSDYEIRTSVEKEGRQHNSETLKVRVYYVSEKGPTIREIRRTGGPEADWEDGRVFNQQTYEIAENSGLTASIVNTCNNGLQLKLYYQGVANKLNVVCNVLDNYQENWATRFNFTK
ncbi:hypothetical protein QQZ08_010550 [Neonectria magnoliae]|uniref:Uncharacterized protein n=1 Tax=Neonectria magnoliae TaxID=2732573 RepID=A0ABR1HHW7_9HYPO